MSTLTPFTSHDGATLRAMVDEHGEPWFIAADVCAVLDIANVGNVLAALDDDERGSIRIADGTSGSPTRATVSEAGLYSLVLRSRKPEAKAFKRWVTHEVLPSIRKTGSYQVAPRPTGSELLALAVMEAQAMLTEKDERIAELEPRAQVGDRLLDASGDLSVADAAKTLRSRAGVPMGRDRLFSLLHTLGWIHRGGDGRWHAKQTAIDTGRITVLPTSHYHPRTGELVLDPPQIRVTPKGLQYLLQHLTADEIGAAS